MRASHLVIIHGMDGRRLGLVFRTVRQHQRLTQREIARKANVSQGRVSLAELGRIEKLSITTLDAIAVALGVRLRIETLWHGGDADRLIDREHAAVVETVARALVDADWILLPEYTFNHFGERGSVDLVGWHPATRSLLVVEAKSRITDVQDLLAGLARKSRIVPMLLRNEKRWDAAFVSRLLVLPGTSANRGNVERHASIFAAALPARGTEIRGWIQDPRGSLGGIWFLSSTRVASRKQAHRVRKRRGEAIVDQAERGALR